MTGAPDSETSEHYQIALDPQVPSTHDTGGGESFGVKVRASPAVVPESPRSFSIAAVSSPRSLLSYPHGGRCFIPTDAFLGRAVERVPEDPAVGARTGPGYSAARCVRRIPGTGGEVQAKMYLHLRNVQTSVVVD